jgi:diguanylate cyclase (GGDEF)-like protein
MTAALLVLAAAVALGAAATLLLWARQRARKRSLATAAGTLGELERRLGASRRRLAEADARWAALRDTPGVRVDPVAVAGPADTLTRLGGRSEFLDRVAHELADRPEATCTLLLLDVDGFAGLTEGSAGDSVLAELAELLREVAGDQGVAFRVGADAFALVVTGGLTEAEQVFARLQAALRQGVRARGVVVTGGIAATEPGDRALEVLLRADDALRQAKRDARGSAVVGTLRASSALPEPAGSAPPREG